MKRLQWKAAEHIPDIFILFNIGFEHKEKIVAVIILFI